MNTSYKVQRCVLALALVLAGLSTGLAQAQDTLDSLLAGIPAPTPAEGATSFAALLKLDEAGLDALIARLTPPGVEDDTVIRYAVSGLAKYVSLGSRESERSLLEGAYLRAMAKDIDLEIKAFLLQRLNLFGSDTAVPALAGMLADETLYEPATQCLIAIGSPAASEALAKRLPDTTGAKRVTCIKALGELRNASVVEALRQSAKSEDTTERRAALDALATIAAPDCADVFLEAIEAEGRYDQIKALNATLAYARNLLDAGDMGACGDLCSSLQEVPSSQVQCALLPILIELYGTGAMPALLDAIKGDDAALRGQALRIAEELGDSEMTRNYLKRLPDFSPEIRAEVILMLGRRGHREALRPLLNALDDEAGVVRIASARAALRIGGSKVGTPLIKRMKKTTDPKEMKAFLAVLLQIKSEKLPGKVAKALADSPAPAQEAFLSFLQQRRSAEAFDAVYALAMGDDEAIRLKAIKALERIAPTDRLPELVDLLVSLESDADLKAAQKLVLSVSLQVTPTKKQSAAVIAKLETCPVDKAPRLLNSLVSIAGDSGAKKLIKLSKSEDTALQAAAIDALASWKSRAVCERLLELIEDEATSAYQEKALNGYLRLALSKELAAEDKVWMHRAALKAAPNTALKLVVLQSLTQAPAPESMVLMQAAMDDEALRNEAILAAATMACPSEKGGSGLAGWQVIACLKQAISLSTDEALKTKMQAHLDTMPLPEKYNLAKGRPVKTRTKTQGAFAPERAVDGDTSSNSAWHGDKTPARLEIDLGEAKLVDRIHIYFHADGSRYYQYLVELSEDGKTWKTVVDQSENTAVSLPQGHRFSFEATKARYAKIKVSKNSANPAVHLVEFKIYPVTASLEAPKVQADEADFVSLFNGENLKGWKGDWRNYQVEFGKLISQETGHMNLFTEKSYSDFVLRFDFKLTPGANNGLGVRAPLFSHAAYDGMELQILDDSADRYKDLKPYQYHGSIYGVVPAKRGYLNRVGEWNHQEVIAKGPQITVILNGEVIVDANVDEEAKKGTADEKDHPGLCNREGHLGFLGHGSVVEFKNIRIKELN